MLENMENFLERIMTEEGIRNDPKERKNSETINKISSIMQRVKDLKEHETDNK